MSSKKMWQPLVINKENYLLKLQRNETNTIFLTNFINIWEETLDNSQLVQRFKNSNPFIETIESTIVKYVVDIFDNPSKNKFSLTSEENDQVSLKIDSEMPNISFQISFNLTLGSALLISQELIIPLTLSLYQSKQKQDEMIEIIAKKDLELKEHKFQAHILDNKNLCTKPCDIALLKSQTPSSFNIFRDCEFKEAFIKNYAKSEKDSQVLNNGKVKIIANSSLKKAKLKRLQFKGRGIVKKKTEHV